MLDNEKATSYALKTLSKYGKDLKWLEDVCFDYLGIGRGLQVGERVKAAQASFKNGPPLKVDGLLGPMTMRRLLALDDAAEPAQSNEFRQAVPWKGTVVECPGVNARFYTDPGALSLLGKGPRPIRPINKAAREKRGTPVLAVDHWDVCMSSASCARALAAQGYSSHAGIDVPTSPTARATVHFWLDPGLHQAVHAGTEANNRAVLATDYCNAPYEKYAAKFEAMVGAPRPIITGLWEQEVVLLLKYQLPRDEFPEMWNSIGAYRYDPEYWLAALTKGWTWDEVLNVDAPHPSLLV